MAQKEPQSERAEKFPLLNLAPAEIAAMGQKGMEDFINAQTELFDKLRETNQQWFERAQSEAKEASEFASKLTTVHSLPEAMTVWQEWMSRRFAMMAEDGKHLLADTQKFMEVGRRFLPNGSSSKKPTAPGT